ncbi:MAG: flagellar biosynthesis repressor FlbT [Desulfatiglans sp.]|jgi:flagellar protein FlbT|nr:flagellar biosynthesis repressor FlbT [Thermodesulfobacteriota bacterium]MEE4351422.1 flagellar biosynthesis repressor FlbT [Desulfatiglans sp.]
MALKITLRPHERVIISGAVITNGNRTADLCIDNKVPVLREKDILKEHEADSPARRIYLVIQLMYIDPDNLVIHHNTYWTLIRDFIKAAPSTLGLIDEISEHILSGRYYKALKRAKKLTDYEEEALSRV